VTAVAGRTASDVARRADPLRPHLLAAGLCAGISAANLLRPPPLLAAAALVLAVFLAAATDGDARLAALLAALVVGGLWWGGVRLDRIDRSPLHVEVGRAGRGTFVVTGPVRRTTYQLRAPVDVRRFEGRRLHEPALLELPLGRAPPQGQILEAVVTVRLPRGPEQGFDERTWLRRHGVHVVLRGDGWRPLGRRGGLGGVADRLRARLSGTIAPGLTGERRSLVEGVVLGEDEGLSQQLQDAFRASGLYHLLAVSGQNVALVAGGALGAAWLLGVSRLAGHLLALAAIAAYVLAVGPQPSVLRAGVAGALGSLAWLAAREQDRWHFLLLGALVLLAWNPYTLLDPGFQLSFAAVGAIFLVAPWIGEVLDGYPLPRKLAQLTAISAACGVTTAPILWLQFGAVPLLSVPANALADPAVVPLLGLGGAAALLAPVAPGAAAAAAWLNGWCAAYLAACARLVASVPFAQAHGAAAGIVAIGGLLGTAYAWLRWHRS
jgi:competence protein ComEC